mgnify:CR=1 FL=1
MTAQVAVMNLNGVSVASDTIATVGRGKTVGSSEKIYQLGEKHKILILHSAAAEITGVPHQLHIAEWAKTLGDPKPTVQAYIDAYKAWAATETRMVTPESEIELIYWLLEDHHYYVRYRLDTEVRNLEFEPSTTERKKESTRRQLTTTIVNEGLEYLKGLENYSTMTEKVAAKLLVDRAIDVDGQIDSIFTGYDLSDEHKEVLKQSAPLVLSKVQRMQGRDSELGFVGFGEEEPYPQVVRFRCRGVYGGTLQAVVTNQNSIVPPSNSASVAYFAQYEAMWGFVNGAVPELLDEFQRTVVEKVEEKWGAETDEPIGWNLANEAREAIDQWAQEKFVDPMLNTIGAMGLTGLAEIADSLVSLQATAANSKNDLPTVGGLIEVATIDRIRGVRWVRRLPHNNSPSH